MDPLSISASIVGLLTFAGATLSTGYRVRHALKESHHFVENLLETLSRLTGVLVAVNAVQASKEPGNQHAVPDVASGDGIVTILQSTVAECRKKIQAIADVLQKLDRCRRPVLATKLHFMKPEIDSLSQEIYTQVETLILCLGADTKRNTDALLMKQHEIVLSIRSVKDRMQEGDRLARELRASERCQSLYKWLPGADEGRHEKASQLLVAGTGDWILQHPQYKSWVEDHCQVLCLSGSPGSGKTVLISKLIESLKSSSSVQSKAAGIASFYCAYNDSNTTQAVQILRSIASQLIRQLKRPLETSILQFFQECDDGTRLPTLSRTQDLLVALALDFEHVYIMIDALDETNAKNDLINCITNTLTRNRRIKLLVSCRPGNYEIWDFLGGWPQIKITAEQTSSDMTRYIQHRLNHGPQRLRNLDQSLLLRKLVEKADGMFLWASCQLDQLSRPALLRDIDSTLRSLPSTLFAAYTRILETTDPENFDLMAKTLACVAHAPFPLRLNELVRFVAIEPRSKSLSDLQMLTDAGDLLYICGSLVRYHETSGVLELAHHSVYEFLNSATGLSSTPVTLHTGREQSLLYLCQISLTFLNFKDFDAAHLQDITRNSPFSFDPRNKTTDPVCSLLIYALQNWWRTLPAKESNLEQIWPLVCTFFDRDTGNFSSTLSLLHEMDGSYRYPSYMTPLHFCALHNLPLLQRVHAQQPQDIEAIVEDGRTPLHMAIENSCSQAVDQLLNLGANVQAQSGDGRTVLQYAIEAGDEQIIEALVTNGAKVTDPFFNGETPFSIAVSNGWVSLIAFLLSNGYDANEKLENGMNSLHIAAQVGADPSVLDMLSRAGVDKLLGDNADWTPLHYAAHYGHYEVLEFLLQGSPSSSSTTTADERLDAIFRRHGWTPLHAAVEQEHLAIIELLASFSSGVSSFFAKDFSSPGRPTRSLVSVRPRIAEASEPVKIRGTGRSSSPRLSARRQEGALLSQNIPSPLWLAVNQEFLTGIRSIVNAGICEKDLDICIEFAEASNKISCLKALGERSINALRSLVGIVQKEAISSPAEQALRELCNMDLKPDRASEVINVLLVLDDMQFLIILLMKNFEPAPGSNSLDAKKVRVLNHALISAIQQHKLEAVTVLCGFGADVMDNVATVATDDGTEVICTALHLAAEINDLSIVSYILPLCTDRNVLDSYSRSALHYAARQYDTEVLQYLLSNQLQRDIFDDKLQTPLDYACAEGMIQPAQMLIDAGASLATADADGRTALHHYVLLGKGDYEQMIELLVSNGAGTEILDKQGFSAFELGIVESLHDETRVKLKKILQLEPGLLYRHFGPLKRTILHYAAEKNVSQSLVQWLLGQGVNVEAEDVNGHTAMQLAEKRMAMYLVNHGARWRTRVQEM